MGSPAHAQLLDQLSSSRPPGPLLLVVAHPDDEVIGVGGQLSRWAPVLTMVHVTDGAPADGADARAAGYSAPAAYAAARRAELAAALRLLPAPPQALLTFSFGDRTVATHLTDLVDALRQVIASVRPIAVITHAYEGGHPDHDALAAAMQMLRSSGAWTAFEFAGYFQGPDGRLQTNRFADDVVVRLGDQVGQPDPASGGDDGRVGLPMTAEARERKRRMLDAFTSQQRVLAAFGCDEEWLRPAPLYDFALPPACGRVWYDGLGWEITGAAWRRMIAVATTAARCAQRC